MGLLSRLFGVDKLQRGMDQVWTQVHDSLSRTGTEFTVSVRETDFPVIGTGLDSLADYVITQLQDQGLLVTTVSMDPWGGVAFLRVSGSASHANAAPQEPSALLVDGVAGLTAFPGPLPRPPATVPDEAVNRHATVLEALSMLGGKDWIGRPWGHREDSQAAYDLVAGGIPDERERRWVGKQVAMALIEHFRRGAFDFDTMVTSWVSHRTPSTDTASS